MVFCMVPPRRTPSSRNLWARTALATALCMAVSAPAWGQATGTAQSARAYSIPAGDLKDVLSRFGRESRTLLAFDIETVDHLRSRGLNGSYTVADGLQALLEGTGIQALGQPDGSYVLRRPPMPAPGRSTADNTLGEVKVTALAVHSEVTEGTGSYAAPRVSLGKGQNIRETPQSISVVTRQRIEDQGLTSVGEVLQQTTGVTVDYAGAGGLGGVANSFYARGFQISNVQMDGAAVDAFSQATFEPNLAMYDSVQVIRGADGLFSGNGEPGGSINFVRKRPTAQPQVLGSASWGSWNQRRAELDVAGPLAADGNVRGRAVLAHGDRDFFYRTANASNSLLYGIVEADLTPSTKLTAGASYEKGSSVPWRGGLPRAANGDDLRLPRRTALMAGWSHYDKTAQEVFAQLDKALAGDWKLKAQASFFRVRSDSRLSELNGAVDPATGLGAELSGFSNDFSSDKKSFDVHMSGSFGLLGRSHRALLGADWTDVRDDQHTHFSEVDVPDAIDIFRFDPAAVPQASQVWRTRSFPHYGSTQKGLYGRLNASLTDRLTAIVGARSANYETQTPYVRYNRSGEVTSSSVSRYSEQGIFTPYGGLTYEIDDRWTAYGSVAEIHKSQASNLAGPLPGKPLDPITGRNFELGAKGEFADGRLMTSMALYRIERKGQAVQDPAYPSTPVGDLGLNCCWLAQGKVVSQGIDLEISGELARGWQAFAGYTFNRNHDKTDSEQIVYNSQTPKHLFKLWSTYRLPGSLSQWTIGAGANIQSAHYVSGTANAFNPATGVFDGPSVPYKFSQRGYAVWNASLQYRINRNWQAALNLNNVFDKIYYRTVGTSSSNNWYGEPRNALLTLRGSF